MNETKFVLTPAQFTPRERSLAHFGSLSATAFQYRSGVSAVRLNNEHGEMIVLPFQGQQVWSAEFGGPEIAPRTLTMRSMVREPRPTQDFLATFGGFLQHCGATGAGVPAQSDSHPLHGELPNAPYPSAYLVTGEDRVGAYIGVGGAYQHTVAFAVNYVAEPLVKIYADSTIFNITMNISNLKRSQMELMYLAHVNFRPVDGGRLVYSVPRTPQHVRVRNSIPSHIRPGPGYLEFIAALTQDPSLHEVISPDLPCDPEVVFFLDYVADQDGWAHTLQIHPDGSADYVRHRPEDLPRATRWISRTPDQEAIAIVEAGTCETEGYSAEMAKGNIRVLAGGETFSCSLDVGVLPVARARSLEEAINQLI